ncbi:MAG: hypothetical protein CM1200mP18_13930 [Gammaproteobacteria bacterium]|nr:MAG: hypothetical protein CM1200mP18_13930 [Gammaproteobacteria bacterium]
MSEPSQEGATTASEGRTSLLKIFLVFLRLGFTSFGGPVAHLGYFPDEFVGRRKWIEERAYADLVALCPFLPGPASSQVGKVLAWREAVYWARSSPGPALQCHQHLL